MSNFDTITNQQLDNNILPRRTIITSTLARDKVKKAVKGLGEIQQRVFNNDLNNNQETNQ